MKSPDAVIGLIDGCKLNIGCGRDIREGWVNVDRSSSVGANKIMDVDTDPWAYGTHNKASEIHLSHVLEHLKNPLFVMEQLWLVAKPDALLYVRVPYGSSDNAWEDQTHVRPYFIGSFAYFSQMYYKGADYGYRGDWEIDHIVLDVFTDRCDSNEGERVMEEIKLKRNMVNEMQVLLKAIKPARDTNGDGKFQAVYPIKINFI